jgi:peptide deformylase
MIRKHNGSSDFSHSILQSLIIQKFEKQNSFGFVKADLRPKSSDETFRSIAKVSPLLRWFGDPVLRRICVPVNLDVGLVRAKQTALKLKDTLLRVRRCLGLGRGLSAPQIGVSDRIFVVLIGDKIDVFVNPRILSFSDSLASYPEMCLSGLPLAAEVIRPYEIQVEYYDVSGHPHIINPDPFLSRIIQHEVDHLNGILFTDKATPQSLRFVFDFDDYKKNSNLIKID